MKKSNKQKAKEIGILYAEKMYEEFQNPDFRGPKFTWTGFPLLVSKIAKSSCFMSFRHNVKNLNVLEEECRKSSFEKASELIK